MTHAREVGSNESEQVDRVIQRDSVAQIPEVHLIDAEPVLSQVHRLQSIGECFEEVAPRAVVCDALTEGERVSRADCANFRVRDGYLGLLIVSEAAGINSNISPGTVPIRNK